MTDSHLADLLEEAAARLRGMSTTVDKASRSKGYTTAELSKETGVPVWTIRRLADQLDGVPVGGSTGYVFPPKAAVWLRSHLRERHAKRK